MFNTELDVCKQLYNEHIKQVSGSKGEHIHNMIKDVHSQCNGHHFILLWVNIRGSKAYVFI